MANNVCWAISEMAIKVLFWVLIFSSRWVSPIILHNVYNLLVDQSTFWCKFVVYKCLIGQTRFFFIVMNAISCLIPTLSNVEVCNRVEIFVLGWLVRGVVTSIKSHGTRDCFQTLCKESLCKVHSRKLMQKEGLPSLNKSLLENNAITLSKWGWVCLELVVPHMDHFVQPWCYALCM
jgi:hypothetical protein